MQRIRLVKQIVRSMIRNESTYKVGKIANKVQEKRFKVILACNEKRGALRRKKGDGNENTMEKEDLREDGWTEWGRYQKRRDCRGRKCTTVLHGGVS